MGWMKGFGGAVEACPGPIKAGVLRGLAVACHLSPALGRRAKVVLRTRYCVPPYDMAAHTRWDTTLVGTANDVLFRDVLLFGYWEMENSRLVAALARSCDRFIDVGAHFGYYTALAARNIHAGGKVLAFEPITASFARLRKTIKANGLDNVVAEQRAIADSGARIRFHLPASGDPGKASSLHGSGETVEVEALRLDTYLFDAGQARAAWAAGSRMAVKMDIEGGEQAALQGMKDTLRQARPLLLIELHPGILRASGKEPRETVAMLQAAGYRLGCLARSGDRIEPVTSAHLEAYSLEQWMVGMPEGEPYWGDALKAAGIEVPA